MKRPLFALGAIALAARLVIGCGTILGEDATRPDTGDASDAGAVQPGADGDTPEASIPDTGGTDLRPDVVSACRTVIFDGFEDPNWDKNYGGLWSTGPSPSGSVTRVVDADEAHSGQAAVHFTTLASGGFVNLATKVGGDCPLTIDFWVMRKTPAPADGSGVILFELSAPGRSRQLRQFGSFLHLDHETSPDAPTDSLPSKEVSKAFDGNTYHHVVITYETSGKMTVEVGSDLVTLDASGSDAVADQIRFGILGSTGADSGKELIFDDVLVY